MGFRKTTYKLTDEDKQMIERSVANPNVATLYYLKSKTSGTWWFPGSVSPRWRNGYDKLLAYWESRKKPDVFMYMNNKYEAIYEFEDSTLYNTPAFFHNHGPMFLDYQRQLHEDRTPIRTVIGGFGSGKTLGCVLSALVKAIQLPGYRCFVLAPEKKQVAEFYVLCRALLEGTLYKERFIMGMRENPNPAIMISHDGIGVSTIECFPIANKPDTLRTLTGDEIIVDQAEHKQLHLEEIIRSAGTRLRGRVGKRSRVGTITFLANADDNDELWDIYDRPSVDKGNYLSLAPSSYDNPFLTDRDIKRFELTVGNSKELRDQYMKGNRPLGDGMWFSRQTLQALKAPHLDEKMKRLIDNAEVGEGPIYKEEPQIGVVEWLLPYEEGHTYLVTSDPGTDKPPNRDSPVILVWDITGFPGQGANRIPAKIVGFVWFDGNKSIETWATRYQLTVRQYKAHLQNGFDATGFQSGYDTWMPYIADLFPEKFNMAGNGKALCLNAARILTTKAMIEIPVALSPLLNQLSRYALPEPKHARQDLVMAFAMGCWWMQRLFSLEGDSVPLFETAEESAEVFPQNRYWRGVTNDRSNFRNPTRNIRGSGR
jgi:hypothetical protein